MCIRCMIKEALREMAGEPKEVTVPVGTISPELLEKFEAHQKGIEVARATFKSMAAATRLEFVSQEITEAEAHVKLDNLNKLIDTENEKTVKAEAELWDELYAELNVDPDGAYSIDRTTGGVVQLVGEVTENDPAEEAVGDTPWGAEGQGGVH